MAWGPEVPLSDTSRITNCGLRIADQSASSCHWQHPAARFWGPPVSDDSLLCSCVRAREPLTLLCCQPHTHTRAHTVDGRAPG